MKNFKLLLVAFLAVITVSSCMKNEDNSGIDYEKEQQRIDSTLKAQAAPLAAYAAANFGPTAKKDSATGIWYEVLPSTVDSTFEYVSYGNSWVPVVANVKYKGQLMDGKVFDEKTTATQMAINNVIPAWLYIFYPKNSTPNSFSGILPDGLLKGNKVRFIAPSPYCYDNKSNENIPANSPLVFTIEVTDVKNQN